MKRIVDKSVSFFGNIDTILVALMAAVIPFKLNLGNIAIIFTAFYALLLLIKKKVSLTNFKGFEFSFPLVLFLIAVASALTSKDVYEGVHQLEKLLLMVGIPIILSVFRDRQVNLLKVFYAFSTGVTIAIVILLFLNFFKILSGESIERLFFFEFTELYDQHPVYFSTNILLSAFFVIHYVLLKIKNKTNLVWVFIILVIHMLGLMFCASKAIIVCFFLGLVAYILFNKRISRKIRLITIATAFVGGVGILSVPHVKERFVTGLQYNSKKFVPTNNLLEAKQFTYEEKSNISDLELRFIFFKIGMYHLIEDGRVLFGYGLGDVQHYLDYYYMTYNLAPNWYEGFNLHNQYLQYLVTYGLFALIIFMIYLLKSLMIAIRTKNFMHLVFMAMILFVFIFETYLARNKGIVLLFFFNTLFLTLKNNFEDSNFRY